MIKHDIEMLLQQLKSNVTCSPAGHPSGGAYAEVPEWQLRRWLDEWNNSRVELADLSSGTNELIDRYNGNLMDAEGRCRNLVILVRRLCHALPPDHPTRGLALDYLKRTGQQGSPLKNGEFVFPNDEKKSFETGFVVE